MATGTPNVSDNSLYEKLDKGDGDGVGITLANVAVYANNAAAVAGGLVAGSIYRTSADPSVLCICTG